jgi:heat shock protein HtpX
MLVLIASPFLFWRGAVTGWTLRGSIHNALVFVFWIAVAGALLFLPALAAIAGGSSDIVSRYATLSDLTALQRQRLDNVVKELAVAAGIDPPQIAVFARGSGNAMAIGPASDPTIVVTPDLLDLLDRQQLQAVLAHETAHIANGDVRFLTFLGGVLVRYDTIVRWARPTGQSAAMTADGYKLDAKSPGMPTAIAAPGLLLGQLFARVTGLAAARGREYLADDMAVRLTRDPQALIDALLVIAKANGYSPSAPGIAHLCIVDPDDPESKWSRLTATHPPLAKRIERLRALLGQQ